MQLKVKDAIQRAENLETSLTEELDSLRNDITNLTNTVLQLKQELDTLNNHLRGHVDVYNSHILAVHRG